MGAFSPPKEDDPIASFLGGLAKALVAAVERPSEFRREVEERMEAYLETGEVGIDRVAADMGLSRQTLYRRLKEDGVTFEDLLDRLRHRLALRYLKRGPDVGEGGVLPARLLRTGGLFTRVQALDRAASPGGDGLEVRNLSYWR